MFDYFEWGDDLPPPRPATSAVVATGTHEPKNENPDNDDEFEIVQFTDIWDRHVIRTGRVLRKILSSGVLQNGKTETRVALLLVAYLDDNQKETLDVIWVSRIVKTKPRP